MPSRIKATSMRLAPGPVDQVDRLAKHHGMRSRTAMVTKLIEDAANATPGMARGAAKTPAKAGAKMVTKPSARTPAKMTTPATKGAASTPKKPDAKAPGKTKAKAAPKAKR